ncbi:sortase, partial [Thomasclavelia ramosa]|uniref:sortase n=1 Tax=Thomasclavelia ramosa TaxID=1547 RepID=UPI001D05A158
TKIKVNMAVYHGTDSDGLNVGAGHIEDSYLPVGGNNTHTVLNGHRGLPSSKLFTRLDELIKGDLFFIK